VSEKVELSEKLAAVDENVRELWDAMDAEQQKSLKNEFFILNRYISNVGTPRESWQKGKKNPTQEEKEHYVIKVNEHFNKHWNLLQKHPKLLWILLCMCSYDGQTRYFHEWVGHKKKTGSNSKKTKFLAELYPSKKMDEIEMLSELTTDKEMKEIARKHGMDEATIAKKLK
jgi:hypothetical protein